MLSAFQYSAALTTHLCPRIVELLREQGMDDCLVLLGGIVPQEDIAKLKAQGVAEIFSAGHLNRRHRQVSSRQRQAA